MASALKAMNGENFDQALAVERMPVVQGHPDEVHRIALATKH